MSKSASACDPIALFHVGRAAIVVGHRLVGVELQHRVVIGDGDIVLPSRFVSVSPRVKRLDVLGIQPQGLAKGRDRLIPVALLLVVQSGFEKFMGFWHGSESYGYVDGSR